MIKGFFASVGVATTVVLLIFGLCRISQASLPTTQMKVNYVSGKIIGVQPFFSPQFRLYSEGRIPNSNDVLTCTPQAKKIGSSNGKNFVATELDCKDQGKFLVMEVDFAH